MHDEMGGACEGPWVDFAPGERIAGFTVEGKIASGSFGTVFKACRDGRSFAVKLVRMGARGDREVDALRRAQFPNVVGFRGYSLWPDDEPRYLVLVLDWIEGRPLDVWAREENPSALELVRQVLVPLASTLADMHGESVVHRDVKESNIVMCEAEGQPVLVDFGSAGYEGAPRLTMWLPPGTPEYRSPEVLRFAREWEGESYPFGAGDDLWALGVTTYWLLTRELPFGDRYDPELFHAILHAPPRAPHVLNPCVPPALGKLCLRMLEKSPDARYADARALKQALEEVVALADDSWRVPLLPGGRRAKSPAPVLAPMSLSAPAAPAARVHPPRGAWASGFILGVAVVLGVILPSPVWGPATQKASVTQRGTLTTPPPPQQAVPRQEVAPVHMTGEVGHGTAPEALSAPATVADVTPEEPAMIKSQKTRSLFAVGCIAGSACASGPQHRPPPKPAACPPGVAATYARFRIGYGESQPTFIPAYEGRGTAIVSEGDITVEMMGIWGRFTDHTRFIGRLYFGTGRVYGRFTQALLPGGEIVPICMEWVMPSGVGVEMEAGSTAEKAYIRNDIPASAVTRFH